jgi:FAD/FMN-containing dehydrogenase
MPSTLDLAGDVITPRDPDYDEARTVFAAVDRRPALIARAGSAQDVATAISYARERGLPLAVRSGGHSPAGHGVVDDGVVIDLSGMRRLEIDPDRRLAWAETGLTAGAYTAAAGAHGLATPFGDAGSVGIGGIATAGGAGFLVRRHGLTIDAVVAAEVVTAAGERLHADARSHPDLFWAIRGGGGNVGVVTRLQLRLHPVGQILGGMLLLPATAEVLEGLVAEAGEAPEELSVIANVMKAPPLPFVPAEHHGRPVVMALLAHTGEVQAGEHAVDRLRALATPIADMVRPMPYPALFEGPEPERGQAAEARTLFADRLDGRAASAVVEAVERSTAPRAVAQLRVLGGAFARVPADATAFAHRDRRIMATVVAMYERPEERAAHEAWAVALAGELRDGADGAYAGFLGDEGPARVRAAYPGAHWERLAAIKAEYDPGNLFRLNQNVPPAREAGELAA